MNNTCKFDVSELKKFRDRLVNLEKRQDEISTRIIEDIANRAKREIIRNTPVGQYSNHVHFVTRDGVEVDFITSDVTGGSLKKGWRKTEVKFFGGYYVVEIYNVEKYAGWVEHGHRIVNKYGETLGWCPGKFMVKISCDLVQSKLDRIIERSLGDWIKEGLGL